MQIFGLIVAIAGWSVALHTFDVFKIKDKSYTHGVFGMIVMTFGILQPFNAIIRPHPPEKGEVKKVKRLIWEIIHKTSGYIAVLLAAVTICYGTIIIFDHNVKFRAAWGCTIGWIVLFSLTCAWDGYRARNVNIPNNAENSQNEL